MTSGRRISVVGTSGSGKTTLAARISRQLGIPHIELDAIHHQAGWTPMPAEEFRAAVAERMAEGPWVIDGSYTSKLGDLVWRNADTLIWFDLPRPVVLWRIVGRTVKRGFTGQELWNGNREHWRNMLSLDPQRSVIVWSWKTHASNRIRYTTMQRDPAYRHLEFVRLRSRREVERFCAAIDPGDVPRPDR